ncbi:hypothetical protein GQ457_15G010320 [Hibiscus cannabinus]
MQFWSYAVLSATYLINRLPTKTLSNKSPFQVLYNKSPDYNFLKVFVSLCYPYTRPFNRHKLSYRSKPCVFLGYCVKYHGYQCLDRSTGKVVVSRHVVFNENVFPYSSESPTVATSSSNCQSAIFPDVVSHTTPTIVRQSSVVGNETDQSMRNGSQLHSAQEQKMSEAQEQDQMLRTDPQVLADQHMSVAQDQQLPEIQELIQEQDQGEDSEQDQQLISDDLHFINDNEA